MFNNTISPSNKQHASCLNAQRTTALPYSMVLHLHKTVLILAFSKTCISCILIIRTYNSVTLNKGAFAISNLYRTLFFMGIRCALRSFQPVVHDVEYERALPVTTLTKQLFASA